MGKKKIFISFHHDKNNQHCEKIRKLLRGMVNKYDDITLNEGKKIENEDSYTDEQLRRLVTKKFVSKADVCIVIVGEDTANRKGIDWEVYTTVIPYDNEPIGNIVVIDSTTNGDEGEIFSGILDEKLMNYYDNTKQPTRKGTKKENIRDCFDERFPERIRKSVIDRYENYSPNERDPKKIKHPVFPVIPYSKVKNDAKLLDLAIQQSLNGSEENRGKWNQDKLRRKNNEKSNRKRYRQVSA